MNRLVLSSERQNATQNRIEEQALIVALQEPGSESHRLATNILLLLRDALHVQQEIAKLLCVENALAEQTEEEGSDGSQR